MGAILKSAVPPSQPRLKPMDVFRQHVGTSFKDSVAFDGSVRNYYTIAYPTLSQEHDLIARIETSDDSKTTITSLVCRNAAAGCKLSFVLVHAPDTPPGHPVSHPILLSCHPTHSKRHCPLMKVSASAFIPSSSYRQFAKAAQNLSESAVEKSAGKTPIADKTLSQKKAALKLLRVKKSAPPEPRLDGDALLAFVRDSSPDRSATSTLIPAGQSKEVKDGSSLDIDTDETMCDSRPVTKDEGKATKDTIQSSYATMKQVKEDRKLKRKAVALTTDDDRLAEDRVISSDAMMKQENKDKKLGRKKVEKLSKLEGEATFGETLLNGSLFTEEIPASGSNICASREKTASQDHIRSKGDEKAVDGPKSSSGPFKSARHEVEVSTLRKISAKPSGDPKGSLRRPKKQPKLETAGNSRPIVADVKVANCPFGLVQLNKNSSQMVDEPAISTKAQRGQQAVQQATQSRSRKDARRDSRKVARQELSDLKTAEPSPIEGFLPSSTRKPHDSKGVSPKNSVGTQDAESRPAYDSRGYLLPNEKEQVGWTELGLIDHDIIKYVRQGLRDPNHLKARGEGSKELFDQLIPLAAGEPESRLAHNKEYRVPLLYSFLLDRDLDKYWKAG